MLCFDTDVLSIFLRRGASPAQQRRLADVPLEEQCTTAITFAELAYGATRRGNERLSTAIEEFVRRGLPIVPFDAEAARRYASLRVELERAGTPLEEADLQIASIALSRAMTVATGNVRHFARVPGLHVEDWLDE
jgi:tRNA(fMet)-specific endonuclease VapC